jgi:thioredoxin 1
MDEHSFTETVRTGLVMVDWWAPWCAPCRMFSSIFDRVAGENPDVVFGKINADDHPGLASMFEIQSIPTLMIFRDGILIYEEPGMMMEDVLRSLVMRAKQLDMDKVRADLAAHTAVVS